MFTRFRTSFIFDPFTTYDNPYCSIILQKPTWPDVYLSKWQVTVMDLHRQFSEVHTPLGTIFRKCWPNNSLAPPTFGVYAPWESLDTPLGPVSFCRRYLFHSTSRLLTLIFVEELSKKRKTLLTRKHMVTVTRSRWFLQRFSKSPTM